MAMSESESDIMQQPVHIQSANIDELLTLADIAGIKSPGNTMKIIIELTTMGIPPQEIHLLIRDILASKSRSKRTNSKSSSKRSNVSTDTVQENTLPQS